MSNICPSREQLMDFTIGELADETAAQIAEHVDTCTRCQTTLEQIDPAANEIVAALVAADGGHQFANEPEFQRAMSFIESIGREPSSKSAGPSSLTETELADIGQYRLLAKIGEGGMGAVYKALHTKLEKLVALKILPRDRTRDEQAVARFEREMKAVGRLEHPNIVRAMDAGEHDGTYYLVIEYVPGADLSDLVRRFGPLSAPDACEIIRQAAAGLAHAHANGLIHRDIKPSNVMLAVSTQPSAISSVSDEPSANAPAAQSQIGNQKSATVKLLDLGLARLQEHAVEDLTSTGQAMGTLDYMAPEQCDDSHAVDARADIYSLGATLYKLLTGEAPFSGESFNTPSKKMAALLTKDVPPIGEQRSGLPDGLVSLVHRMLAKDPSQRVATAGEVAERLAPYATGADLVKLANKIPVEKTDMRLPTVVERDATHAATDEYLSSSMTETRTSHLNKQPAASSLLGATGSAQ